MSYSGSYPGKISCSTWKSYYTISEKSSLHGELRMILIFQVILAGFAEQSKTSVVHMCSLFHAFILCQLWTVYLEQWIAMAPASSHGNEAILLASSILLDFWGKVTPGKYIDTVVAKYWQIVFKGIKALCMLQISKYQIIGTSSSKITGFKIKYKNLNGFRNTSTCITL